METEPASVTYRLRRGLLYQGVGFSILFVLVLVGHSCLVFLPDPEANGFQREHAKVVLLAMGWVICGFMLMLSLYVWRAYYVERLTIDGSTIHLRSIFQNRQFQVRDIETLRWRDLPRGGAILFRLPDGKLRLHLDGYTREDRLQIIWLLRQQVPLAVQEGWPRFCHRIALPLRDGVPFIVRDVSAKDLQWITRRRYDRALMFGLPASALVAAVLIAWLGSWSFLGLPAMVVICWLLLRKNVPAEGSPGLSLTSCRGGRTMLIAAVSLPLSHLVILGLQLLNVDHDVACGAGLGVLLLGTVPLMLSGTRRYPSKSNAETLAVEAWESELPGRSGCA